MKNKILSLMRSAAGLLVFALLCGFAYYSIILKFILSHTSAGGGLLGFFFLPAIICGAALIIIKLVKQSLENGRENAVIALFWIHVLLIAMGIVFILSIFI